ncbi:MAG: GtrA family protein [Clostridia bacterium]|nr:GtrA family protein [Clostridia bacterium]
MKKFFDKSMIKFALVGVINTLIGAGTMFLLYNLAHCSYWISSAANYLVGGVVSFFLNKYYTFNNKDRSWRQVIKFALTVSVCYLLSYGAAKPAVMYLLKNLDRKWQENIAMAVGMCLYFVLNYLGQRFFAFNQEDN